MWEYLAGVFDIRGFLHIKTERDEKGRTKFYLFFNFTEKDEDIFRKISNFLNEQGIKNSIYFLRKKSNLNLKEFGLWITNRRNTVKFLERIYDYSLKKDFIEHALRTYNSLLKRR